MRVKLILLALLSLLVFGVSHAAASVSGVVEWRYADYQAEEDGEQVSDASHFTQLYSLIHQKRGYISDGRAGKYDLGLGLEWSSIDSSINDEDFSADNLKLLFRGDVLLAPGGLPFRLNLYSHDMSSAIWSTDGSIAGSEIINPDIITGMRSGQHIRTGGTLMVGIRNGSYLGRYRETLSQFPRLLVDYKEDYVRDMDTETPQHYRSRNLAFVSLNKKDNWFHYRLYEYTDYEDETENYIEKTYLLGTVDHTLTRQWINFTNWLKVSTDGSYTVTNRTTLEEIPERIYNYNLFAVANRRNWRASAFPSMNRTTDGESVDKSLEIPLFYQRDIDRDTAYRMRLIGSREIEDYYVGDRRDDEGDVYFSAIGEMRRTRPHVFSPRFEAEVKTGNQGKGYGLSSGVEYFTNRAFRPPVDWFVSYSITNIDGTAKDGSDVGYLENQLLGRLEGSPSTSIRTGVEQRFIFGEGTSGQSVTNHIGTIGDTGLVASRDSEVRRSGSTFRSTTTWFTDHQASRRLSNRFEIIYDYLSSGGATADQTVLRHNLRYDRRTFLAKIRNELTLGDDISNTTFGSEDMGSPGGVGNVDKTFVHGTSVRYAPGRSWEAGASLDYYWQNGDAGSTNQVLAKQLYKYGFFRQTGALRRLAELREEFEYEKVIDVSGGTRSMYGILLAGDLYPSRRTLVGIRARYRTYQPEDFDEYLYTLSTGLNYSRFSVSFDYSYGIRTAAVDDAKRNEHRWEVIVKKTF